MPIMPHDFPTFGAIFRTCWSSTSFYLVLLRSEVFRRLRDGPVVLRTAALGVAGQWAGRLELPGRGGSWIQKKDTF